MEVFRPSSGESPAAPRFPVVPACWYYVGTAAELAGGAMEVTLPGNQSYVAFRFGTGAPAVLTARCSHMGANLARGCVKDGRLVCPLHGWEYGADGRCAHIPATRDVPSFARQLSFPVAEVGGQVFFYNRSEAAFPMPFFRGEEAARLYPARVFDLVTDTPWYLISANGFDMQHFRCSHDRTVVGEAEVDAPDRHAWRVRAKFAVTGTAPADRLTKWFSGSEVAMTVETWAGALLLVTARFRRTTTYGLVSLLPLENQQTRVRDVVWVRRSRTAVGRLLLDPLNARLRRWFIREFLQSDVTNAAGIRYHPERMLPEDRVLVDYLQWLEELHRPARIPIS